MAMVYLADINDFSLMNEAWDAWVPEGGGKISRKRAKCGHIISLSVKQSQKLS